MAQWLTVPFETTDGNQPVIGSVRKDVDRFRNNPRFHFRIEISWPYTPAAAGMPDEATAILMEKVQEALEASFKKDPVAVLSEIYTGAGERRMVFYTLSLHIFQRKFNEALSELPPLPLEFDAADDPDWEEYKELLALAEDTDSDEEVADGGM